MFLPGEVKPQPGGSGAQFVRVSWALIGKVFSTFLLISGRNTVTTICNDDLSDALILIAELLKKIIGNPGLVGNLNTDPERSQIQTNAF